MNDLEYTIIDDAAPVTPGPVVTPINDVTPSPLVSSNPRVVFGNDSTGVDYVFDDGKSRRTIPSGGETQTVMEKAQQKLLQLQAIRRVIERATQKKLNAGALKARVTKRRKRDKLEKKSRKRNRS
jgi:hypothetical protein